ncbi:LRR receptor-like serine threonine-protein kinase [Seminavis robusta]|uniref:LRR receptor-like serine threonine-protein kinase n=1 Tax=Seminavis robusta TaxID=568900 RepID=A0A9N8E6H6_9STRA|nr:LRR receptor-like serine threonine-protein kinase [Seminavis robusta]|eukprot:Sro702_g189950.1 LRR receptor-like serine threonine-protein kinase (523) ;mRNA; f:25933-28295
MNSVPGNTRGPDESSRARFRRCLLPVWKHLWAILASIVIVSSLVAIFLFRFLPYPSAEDTTTVAESATKVPSSANGRQDFIDRRRFILFRSSLARVSEPSAFVNPNSPQSQALKWLVYQDQTIQIPTDTLAAEGDIMNSSQLYYSSNNETFHWKLVQRYALMVLAFSTNGATWRGIVPWEEMVDVDECHSHFQGIGCDEVLGKVNVVNLDYRKLGGKIPVEIGLLTDLTYLDLSRNHLEGHIPHSIYHRLTNLEHLALSHNEIAFSLSNDIGKLTALNALVVSNTHLSGTLPATMAQLTELREFFHSIKHWPNLEVLSSTETLLSPVSFRLKLGSAPTCLRLLSLLVCPGELAMLGTGFNGSLPTEIGLLSKLTTMVAGGDQLIGSLPSEIGSWTRLGQMIVSFAPQLTGSLPSTIGQLSSLTYMAIVSTSIGGSVPSEIGLLQNVVNLNLENNLFGGQIPSQALVGMESLTNLQINANFFSGTIPQEICDAESILVWMDCAGNLVCENDCCPGVWCSFGDV